MQSRLESLHVRMMSSDRERKKIVIKKSYIDSFIITIGLFLLNGRINVKLEVCPSGGK